MTLTFDPGMTICIIEEHEQTAGMIWPFREMKSATNRLSPLYLSPHGKICVMKGLFLSGLPFHLSYQLALDIFSMQQILLNMNLN